MKQRFILYRRKRGGMFYIEDTETRKQESLGTRNRPEALTLLNARNESVRQPQLNLHIARAYLAASDPGAIERPWRVPLEEIGKTKKGATRDRWLRVLKDDAFDLIRDLPLLETRPEHLLKVMEVGTVSTNVFLRRVHNFALDMGWLPWPLIPKKHWPKINFREKRAITPEEHQAILDHEPNPDRTAFYQLCWLLGASQSDVAFLASENVDWPARVISFARKKTKTVSMIHFGDEVEAVLKTLPSAGPFFPKMRKLNSGHRATEFTRVCRRAGVHGVTLHCYRYAWAERAQQCGYPERFAQEALGHNSKAVHRAYRIRNRTRGDFQIEGVSDELCDRFSKRHEQIDAALEKLLADKPELKRADVMALRRHLATAERSRKQKDLSQDELRRLWDAQTTNEERVTLQQLSSGLTPSVPNDRRPSLNEAVQWAEEHLFDRPSVVMECQVWQEALGRARGEDFSLRELKDETRRRAYIRQQDRPHDVTLREVLLREWEIVRLVRDGASGFHPLVAKSSQPQCALDEEQRRALDHLLASTNEVTLFRGGAGTGKSYVLRELATQMQQNGRAVVVLAPQRQQVVDMEAAGFPSPTSVTAFLQKRNVPSGAVIVVDEAGQIGGRQMLDLLRLAHQRHARVVLSGDTRQHGPVEASDALMAIERHSGVAPVELHTIRRQDPALGRDDNERRSISRYRKAVEAAAAGRLADSFECLDKMGAVVIFNQKVRHADAGTKGKLAGIVSAGVLVEVDGKFITVQNRLLGRINVCVPRDLALAAGDRIHLKANRKLDSGNRVANGELATVKAVRPDGAVELEDGRVLDATYREFSPGYAVTSYGSQGKTVDYVLFSDSTIKAATNAQQWYVTISRGRRGIRIRLVFATHEVVVRGHSLRRIETAMQRMELSHLACLPGSYRSLLADGQPFVREIAVQELKEAASAQEGSPN